ncbi:MAG: hypothetical protein QXO69_02780, partial [archaeon]
MLTNSETRKNQMKGKIKVILPAVVLIPLVLTSYFSLFQGLSGFTGFLGIRLGDAQLEELNDTLNDTILPDSFSPEENISRIDPLNSVSNIVTTNFTASGTWTAPQGITYVLVEAWGGGGAGGGRTTNGRAGGGGGGAYAAANITVIPGNNYTVTVAGTTAGGSGNGANGGASYFGNGSQVSALGGSGGLSSGTGGAGGSAASSNGTVKYNGGNGGTADFTWSGGGGGGAGSTGAGGNANVGTAGTGTSELGGNGGAGRNSQGAGNAGNVYGGGGGGGVRTLSGNRNGGDGAAGFIRITYETPDVTLVSPANDNVTTASAVNFSCNATDSIQLKNITLYWNYSGTWQANGTTSVAGTANSTMFERTGLANGAITWNCYACSNRSNCGFAAANRTVIVNESIPATPPAVSLASPTNDTKDSNGRVDFFYSVSDSSNILNCSLLLNGSVYASQQSVVKDTQQKFSAFDLPEGSISWSVRCFDGEGPPGTSEERKINISRNGLSGNVTFSIEIEDPQGQQWNATFELIDEYNNLVDYNASTNESINISKGKYNIRIIPQNASIASISLFGANIVNDIFNTVDIDESVPSPIQDVVQSFALNPNANLSFENASFNFTAQGNNLFKCADWNFSLGECYGEWAHVMSLTPEQEYSISFNTSDPAYVVTADGNSACVNTSMYRACVGINSSTTTWGYINDFYSNNYNPSTELSQNYIADYLQIGEYQNPGTQTFDVIANIYAPSEYAIKENGSQRVFFEFNYSDSVYLNWYFYDEYYVGRFIGKTMESYDDGYAKYMVVNDTNSTRGLEFDNLGWAYGSKSVSPINTTEDTGSLARDVFDQAENSWASWYGSVPSDLAFGAINKAKKAGTSAVDYIGDVETTGSDYIGQRWYSSTEGQLDNYDTMFTIGMLYANSSYNYVKNIFSVYQNPAVITAISNGSSIGFNDKAFIYEMMKNATKGNTLFNVTGNASWDNSTEKLYFIVYNASNNNNLYRIRNNSAFGWETLLLNGSIQYNANGSYYNAIFYVNANKTANEQYLFGLDNIKPVITIESPANTTYYTPSIWFNVTAMDNVNVASCLYSIDGNANVTMSNDTATHYYHLNASVPEGAHSVTFYCNDSSNNINETTQYFTVLLFNPVNLTLNGTAGNATYTYPATINATATSSWGTVYIYRNGTLLQSGSPPQQNLSFPAAGTYEYKANATNNATGVTYYAFVNQGTPLCSLTFDKSTPQTYGAAINATCSCTAGSGTVNLYRNGTQVTGTENGTLVTLPAGPWNYTCNTTGNENYTAASNSSLFTINKASNPVALALNGTQGNVTFTYPAVVNATGSAVAGVVSVYRDGSLLQSGVSPQVNISGVLANGTYEYKVNATGNQNYSDNETGVSYFVFVNKALSTCSLSFNPVSPSSYGTPLNVSCSCSNAEVSAQLFRNGSDVSGEIGVNVSLGAGDYEYVCNVSSSENYSAASNSSVYVVSKAGSLVRLFLNGSEGNVTYNVGDFANFTVSLNVSGKTVYLNSTIPGWALQSGITPLENVTQLTTVGTYAVTGYFPGDENYTSSSVTYYANVSDFEAPKYSNDADDSSGSVPAGTIVNVSVYWTDDGGLDAAILRHNSSGSWANASINLFSGALNGWYNASINTSGLGGSYVCWNQYANDTSGNTNATMPQNLHCFNVTIVNTAPEVTTPVIYPEPAYKTTDLVCSVTLNDSENVSLTAFWSWFKNGALNLSGSTVVANGTSANVSVLSSGNLSKGDSWVCEVTPSDGLLNGTAKNSTAKAIQNSIPLIGAPTLNDTAPYTDSVISCVNGSFYDVDGDAATWYYRWLKNGTL